MVGRLSRAANQIKLRGVERAFDEYIMDLIPERLKGEIASFDIKDPHTSEIIVAQGRRITIRHIKIMEKAGINKLTVPYEYLIGKIVSSKILNEIF